MGGEVSKGKHRYLPILHPFSPPEAVGQLGALMMRAVAREGKYAALSPSLTSELSAFAVLSRSSGGGVVLSFSRLLLHLKASLIIFKNYFFKVVHFIKRAGRL